MAMDKADYENYIEVANDQVNYALKDSVAKFNLILVDDGKGCRAELEMKDFKATVSIKPNKKIAPRDVNALSEYKEKIELVKQDLLQHGDLALDVLDIIFARWLKSSNSCEDFIEISADEILTDRGLKKKISSSGRRGGYSETQRNEIGKMVKALSCLYINVEKMKITEMVDNKKVWKPWKGEGKVLELKDETESEDQFTFKLRLGKVLTKSIFLGRETALLNKKALQYNPHQHRWEKRLTRYLSWLWRISFERSSRGLKVNNLLETVGMELNISKPNRTKVRFENSLNRLQKDGVIGSWQYKDFELNIKTYGWWKKWKEIIVVIHPPDEIVEQYKKVKDKLKKIKDKHEKAKDKQKKQK